MTTSLADSLMQVTTLLMQVAQRNKASGRETMREQAERALEIMRRQVIDIDKCAEKAFKAHTAAIETILAARQKGQGMPDWDTLPELTRKAWHNAAVGCLDAAGLNVVLEE